MSFTKGKRILLLQEKGDNSILFNKGMNENKNKKKTVAICTEIAVKLEIPGIQNVANVTVVTCD